MIANKSYIEGLNKEQYQAVTEKFGPILVLAGAGSGKTKVLTSRIANLVDSGVNPFDILSYREKKSKTIGDYSGDFYK